MKKISTRKLVIQLVVLTILFSLAALSGCDGSYVNFLNARPVQDMEHAEPVHVIVGIDGFSKAAFEQARAAGAFAGYQATDVVTVFPGTSDYAWTRTLHTSSIKAYETEYYKAEEHAHIDKGLIGVAKHPLRQQLWDVYPCYKHFDFVGDGETWMLDAYLNPESHLRGHLDNMFDTIQHLSKRQQTITVFIAHLDIIDHLYSLERVVEMTKYIDQRIEDFKRNHPERYRFTIISDHGNTHRQTELVDPQIALAEVGISSVDALSAEPRLEAVAIANIRTNYLAIYTHQAMVVEIGTRLSRQRWIDLAVAPLGESEEDGTRVFRYGFWRAGLQLTFGHTMEGEVLLEDAEAWRKLGLTIEKENGAVRLTSQQALSATMNSPWPDLFYRVHTAFTSPAVEITPNMLISMRDEYACVGFRLPGGPDAGFAAGFHGSLSYNSTMAIAATELPIQLPPVVRSDDLLHLFP